MARFSTGRIKLAVGAVVLSLATYAVSGSTAAAKDAGPIGSANHAVPRERLTAAGKTVPADTKRDCLYSYHRVDTLVSFGRTVGRPFDCALVFNNAAPDWAGWQNPWFVIHPDPNLNWARWATGAPGRLLVITQSMIPSNAPVDWRQRGARGEYDAYAHNLASVLVGAGLGASVIRLGHEGNNIVGNPQSVGLTPSDISAWRSYWARIVTVMRSVPGAHFEFDWTINAGYKAIPFDQYYPGDTFVDVIGIDIYDFPIPGTPASTPDSRWLAQYNQPGGPAQLTTFARAHGKPLSIPEWGLVAPQPRGGAGDNPRFIDGIASIVRSNPVRYQAYFLSPGGGVNMVLTNAPHSLTAYQQHFGPNGDATH